MRAWWLGLARSCASSEGRGVCPLSGKGKGRSWSSQQQEQQRQPCFTWYVRLGCLAWRLNRPVVWIPVEHQSIIQVAAAGPLPHFLTD